MTIKHKAVCIAILAASLPTAAQAHWQYTRWGMTEAQVLTASKGQAVRQTARYPRAGEPPEEIVGKYATGGRAFNVRFTFDSGGLAAVSLTTESCGGLDTDLRSTYGRPINETGRTFPTIVWDDRRNSNRVTYIGGLLGSCQITYEAFTANSGL